MKNDIRTIKTKAAIKQAFQTLMKDSSFDKLTIQKICDKANVNRVTFYNHYQDKYDLFKEYLDEILMDIFNSSNCFLIVGFYLCGSHHTSFFVQLEHSLAKSTLC